MARAFSSETHAYAHIKKELKRRGFDCRNPNRIPHGEVFTQHEVLANEDLKKSLNGGIPEYVIKLGAERLWVIEAKRHPYELKKALFEATNYADDINQNSCQHQAIFASGVAGSDEDGYKILDCLPDRKT